MKGFRQCAVAARFWGFALDLLSQSGARVRVRVGSERHNLVHRARSPRLSLALVVYSCVRFSVVWDSFCGMHEYTVQSAGALGQYKYIASVGILAV